MSIEQNPSFKGPYIGPIADSLRQRDERLERWSKWHLRAHLGVLGTSIVGTAGAPLALFFQGRDSWTIFLGYTAGLAATTIIASSIPIIDGYLRRAIKHLTPEELKLYKAELERLPQPPEEPGEGFAIEIPEPPPLSPSPALVLSPIRPRPGGSGAAVEEKIERESVLIK